MPGHRRDDEPDDTTRVQSAIPAAAPEGDAHGSTVAGAPTAERTVTTTDRTPTTPSVAPAVSPPAHPDTATDTTGAPATRTEVVAAQKARYGGISWGSAFFGWLSANGVAVLLIALLSAAGVAFGLTSSLDSAGEAADQAATLGIGGGIALLVLLFLAYLAGGYVAGRMARFDGAKQGIAVWVIGLVVVLLLALAGLVFGAQYNVLSRLNLPRIPIDEGTATTAGIIALVAVLLVTLVAAVLGGLLGARYHRKVDRVGYEG
ncbi:MAG: conserved rane protein of unknown function [Modestobacter sp.]|jgi:hypothetical protein|nr:conserved rane protein of unknown function [Modestobacter sp.]